MPAVLPLAADAWDWGRFGIVLAAGFLVGQLAYLAVARADTRGEGDPRGLAVLGRLVRVTLVTVALIYALAQLGVRIGPLLTAAGIGGVALAFAVQNIFQNFLAGILLLVRRPFRPGDQICSQDFDGTVEDVNLRAVVLRTYDGQRVFLPNGSVLSNPLVNRTAFAHRRSELAIGVSYDADLEQARALIEGALGGVEEVLDDPPPQAYVYELAESSVNLCARFWHAAPMADMWRARHAAAVAVKRALDEAGIDIPFPQRDLRVIERS